MEAAIIQLLLDAAGVTGLVGTRVYPTARPQGSAFPAVVVTRIGGAPEYASDGETGLQSGRVQIEVFGATYTSTLAVRNAMKTDLSGIRGVTSSGVDFQFVTIV